MAVNFKFVILQHIVLIDILSTSDEMALRWILKDFTDDKSTLVQAIRQQAFTWTNVGQVLCGHMVLLGANELMEKIPSLKVP